MQIGHLKEVVENISDGIQLEFQLQRCQEEKGVAVLDVYNTEWGHCRTLSETFKRLYTDIGNDIPIRFFSVECDTITKKFDHSLGDNKKKNSKLIEYYEDTKSSFWGALLQKRDGHSKPYFLLYKEGKMRAQIEGVDTPKICKLIKDLCKPDPVTQCLTNPVGLTFWKDNFPVTKTEIPFTSFIDAVERTADLRLSSDNILVLKDAIGVKNGVCTATGLQSWLKDSETLSECLSKIISVPDEAVRIGSTPNLEERSDAEIKESDIPPHCNGLKRKSVDVTEQATELEKTQTSLQEGQRSSSNIIPQDEPGSQSELEKKDPTPTEDSVKSSRLELGPEDNAVAANEDPLQAEDTQAQRHIVFESSITSTGVLESGEKTSQIFTDHWIDVSQEELIVWKGISDLPLHYPDSSTALLRNTCEEAEQKAYDLISDVAQLPTLRHYLQICGLSDTKINIMCLAARQKIGSESPFYGMLSLILMTSHSEELVGLLPEPVELVTELTEGTLIENHGPLGFTALCLCASEAFPDEELFYIPPPPLDDRLKELVVGNVLPLPALTPLRTSIPTEDTLSMKIVGLPKVIELASSDDCDYVVVLSDWFSKLEVVDRTETLVTAQFIELLCEEEYRSFSQQYAERLMEDENKLDKKTDKTSITAENETE